MKKYTDFVGVQGSKFSGSKVREMATYNWKKPVEYIQCISSGSTGRTKEKIALTWQSVI